MPTVHHLGKSQSERVVWLCEELAILCELKRCQRDAVTVLAPPGHKAPHPSGAAPVTTDGDLVLAKSGVVVEYPIAKRGGARAARSRARHGRGATGRRGLSRGRQVHRRRRHGGVLSPTTTRPFMPIDLARHPNILSDLRRVGGRGAHRTATRKGDPDMVPLLT